MEREREITLNRLFGCKDKEKIRNNKGGIRE